METERTPDGRYLVIDGRRWRATDPSIPESFRQELVAELMAARRAVQTDAEAARTRVHQAKVALGERGQPWWEEPEPAALQERIVATIRTLLGHRTGTICPSDVARVVGGEHWRGQMDVVRRVAFALASTGEVVITQRGRPVDPDARGPLRIGWAVPAEPTGPALDR